ncbi:unnamed protein product [Rotaria magnacalcarata]|uniref:SH3 domain-binding protein 5-like protein n=6 Tax=Rotaria magnacalcarata TaxID=392030 RepID=A0A815NDJ1_9BILA|nr:unnamed protein product [Rotaria magnacalcarata]CAF1564526.1 unnamed protein product [Rotaria magnacalcarata]CAF2146771.1 unnamed protein product [Rotaria magnacalcarata]
MSDSSKIIESDNVHSNEANDEPLDPRIQIELERANAATSEINNLETQLDNAQKLFQISFSHCKQRLANLAKTLGRCVERGRPYYDAFQQAEEARLETGRAAQEYQNSVELHCTAKENLAAAENQLSESDNVTWQECMNHLTMKVMQIEQDKMRYERIHEEKSKLYQEYEQQRIKLHHSLTRAIIKSKPYFDAKFKAEHELKNQKYRIEDVQNAIIKAKRTYRAALNSLEQISDEIHRRRKNQILLKLPLREPGVGAETPEEFIELPKIEFSKIDLSNQSSEHDLSKSMNSMSVNTSTDCIYRSSNINLSTNISPLTNNKFEDHCRTQMIASVNNDNDQRMQKRLIPSRSIRLKSTWLHKPNETPLLSHLFGTHKYHSDPNLNASTK